MEASPILLLHCITSTSWPFLNTWTCRERTRNLRGRVLEDNLSSLNLWVQSNAAVILKVEQQQT